MPLLGSEEAGLGSVLTAAGNAAGGNTPSGNGTGIAGKFSAVSGSSDDPTTTYMDDAASVGGGSAIPLLYPAPAMTITGLYLSATVGTGLTPPTATLMKNGVATAITCTLPPSAAAGTTVADTAHSVTYAAGDTFDLRLTQDVALEGSAPFTATLEGSLSAGGVGGGFPGYGPAPPAVAAGSAAGVSALVSRADHTHAQDFFAGPPTAMGISQVGAVTSASRGDHGHVMLTIGNASDLPSLTATAMVDGTIIYCSARDAYFHLVSSALATNTWDTFAASVAGKQWQRLNEGSVKAAAQATWFVDGSAGNDDATGATSGTPLKTLKELSLRLGLVEVRQNTTINLKNVGATDTGTWTYRLPANILVSFVGTLDSSNQIGAGTFGTVASFTVPGVGAGTGDVNFSDTSIPTSFTASGLLSAGVIFKRTNSTALYWFAAKDKGSKTCRISRPTTAGSTGVLTALAVNDTYAAYTLPTIPVQRFTSQQGCRQTQYQFLNYGGAVAIGGQLTPMLYANCWRAAATGNVNGGRFAGCCIEVTSNTATTFLPRDNVSAQFSSGCIFRESAATGDAIASFFWHSTGVQAFTTFQGVSAQAFDGGYLSIEGDWYHNDTTIPCVDAQFSSVVQLSFGTSNACLIGSGNTSKLARVANAGRIEYFNATPFVAGSTSDANPIQVDGASSALASLPKVVGSTGSGVYLVGTAGSPFLYVSATPANGAVTVTMNNAPAGSPAAPVRYVQIPDGAGGTLTIASLT